MPFFNNTVLKFINKPNLQLLNFKYVKICAKCKSFNVSTDLISIKALKPCHRIDYYPSDKAGGN